MRLIASNLTYSYPGSTQVLFDDFSLECAARTVTAIRGPSGSGKSTLLDLLGGVRKPLTGYVRLYDPTSGDPAPASHMRACGWVLQRNIVLSRRTVLDNVKIGALAHGGDARSVHRESLGALDRLGLGDKAHSVINTLSGGEQQRVTIARCLIAPSALVIADEPTGNLDAANTALVVACLRTVADAGKIVVVATHDSSVVSECDRAIDVGEG